MQLGRSALRPASCSVAAAELAAELHFPVQGRAAYLEKRKPDFSQFPRLP